MRILILLITLTICLPATAAIYKWVDENGNVVFGDQPPVNQNKQEIKQQPLNTYSEPKRESATPEAAPQQGNETTGEADKTTYSKFSIAKPSDDEAIRSNNGQLTIQLNIEPSLDQAAGHQIQIQLDGEDSRYQSTSITLEGLFRGTHTLKATIIDSSGKSLKQSKTHTFHLLRNSAN